MNPFVAVRLTETNPRRLTWQLFVFIDFLKCFLKVSIMAKAKTKRCSMCCITKPAEDMGKNGSAKDGLSGYCKACAAIYRRLLRNRGKVSNGAAQVETWEQVEGLLRTMAETQLSIQTEEAKFKDKVRKIEMAFTETVEAWACQVIAQQIIITDFVKQNSKPGEPVTRCSDFGKITSRKGKVEIKLNPDTARKRWGKP